MAEQFGITPTGFNTKPLSTVIEETNETYRSRLGENIDLVVPEPIPVIKEIENERESSIWELAQELYANLFSDEAEGVQLDNLFALNGISRAPATASLSRDVILTGTPSTPIPDTLLISVDGSPNNVFKLIAPTTIGGGGTVTANFLATQTGPIIAPAGTLTVIDTAITGLDSVTNPNDTEIGTDVETDADYKARRKTQLGATGGCSDPGQVNALTSVEGVTSAFVVSNRGDAVDLDGRPGHSFEALVLGGADQDIGEQIFIQQGSGIQSFGGVQVFIVDQEGVTQEVFFSRIVSINLEYEVDITPNTNSEIGPVYPVDGDDQVKNISASFTNALAQNVDVINTQVKAAIVSTVPGILAITLRMAIKPATPLDQDILIEFGDKAVIIVGDITVNS